MSSTKRVSIGEDIKCIKCKDVTVTNLNLVWVVLLQGRNCDQ